MRASNQAFDDVENNQVVVTVYKMPPKVSTERDFAVALRVERHVHVWGYAVLCGLKNAHDSEWFTTKMSYASAGFLHILLGLGVD